MVESIIDFQIAKLDLTNYFDKTYCLTELKSDGEKAYPVHYVGNGNWERIEIDQFNGVAYFRKGESTSAEIDNPLTTDILYQSNFPLRLVAYKRRDSFDDDAYDADGLGNSLKKSLTFRNESLQSTLKARSVKSIVSSVSTDSAAIYAEEYDTAPNPDIPFKWVVVALDIDVEVVHTRDCMDDCPTDTDILHSFNFCQDPIFDRLTQTQKDCLEDKLCGTCDDATVKSALLNPEYETTVASGGTLVLPKGKMLDSDGVTEVTFEFKDQADGIAATATPCSSPTITFTGGSDVGYGEALIIGCSESYDDYYWHFCSQDFPNTHMDATGQNPSPVLNWDGVWDVQLTVRDGTQYGFAETTVTVVDGLRYHNLNYYQNTGGGYTGTDKLVTNNELFYWPANDNFIILSEPDQLTGDGGFIFQSGRSALRTVGFDTVRDDPTTGFEYTSATMQWAYYWAFDDRIKVKDGASFPNLYTTTLADLKWYKIERVSGDFKFYEGDSFDTNSWTELYDFAIDNSNDMYLKVYLHAGSDRSYGSLFKFGSYG